MGVIRHKHVGNVVFHGYICSRYVLVREKRSVMVMNYRANVMYARWEKRKAGL